MFATEIGNPAAAGVGVAAGRPARNAVPMGKVLESLDDELRRFLGAQRVFFVATAPSGDGGHVNLSPKGYDSFRIVDDRTVAYLDLTGSGVETIAHLRQNGRITLMFCAFEGPPRILRLYGAGEVILPTDPRWADLAGQFSDTPGARSIIRVRVDRISTSCGYAVPFLEFRQERDTLRRWAEKKGPDGLSQYHQDRNALSIDGLPGLPPIDSAEQK